MILRKYRAYSMAEALAAVKRDLGADAVILQSRSVSQGGLLGSMLKIGRRVVVEVTAASAGSLPKAPREPALTSQAPTKPVPTAARAPGAREAAATRAYSNGRPAARIANRLDAAERELETAAFPSPDGLDRDRTRLLAQAMAVRLEREQAAAPSRAATAAAAANEGATRAAALRRERGDDPAIEPKPDRHADPVAQRYILVSPSADGHRASREGRAEEPPPPPPRQRARREVEPSETNRGTERVARLDDAPRAIPRAADPTLNAPPAAARPAANDDFAVIDRLVDEVLTRAGAAVERPERLAELYASLIERDVAEALARSVVDEVGRTLSPEELASEHAVRGAATAILARHLPACAEMGRGADGSWRRGGRPLTIALVGPTGVGKTTTVAKIAATLKLRDGARVGLITCDTYRIAAVDQLRTYAEIIGVPLEIVMSPSQMRHATRTLGELDVIVIDTAGRSQNDEPRLAELRALVRAADPHETHLVLSSVASAKTLMREAEAFATLEINRVILTKLDESAGLGATLGALQRLGREISFLTAGQEVPQHLERARPERVAEFLMGPAHERAPVEAVGAASGGDWQS